MKPDEYKKYLDDAFKRASGGGDGGDGGDYQIPPKIYGFPPVVEKKRSLMKRILLGLSTIGSAIIVDLISAFVLDLRPLIITLGGQVLEWIK